MTTYITSPHMNVYTELSFDEARKALVDGAPIRCWWFTSDGARNEETILFTEFSTIQTVTLNEHD